MGGCGVEDAGAGVEATRGRPVSLVAKLARYWRMRSRRGGLTEGFRSGVRVRGWGAKDARAET
jgi:hypothetical protein